MGRGGLRPGPRRGQAGFSIGRLLDLPLVPCDGAREFRKPRHRRGDEPALHQYQSGPRGAARPRCRLHGLCPGQHRPGRLANERVAHPRRPTPRRRHLLSARRRPRSPGLSPRLRRTRPPVARRARPHAGERRRHVRSTPAQRRCQRGTLRTCRAASLRRLSGRLPKGL